MTLYERVVALYKQNVSLCSVAKACHCSEHTARRILLTEGVYEEPAAVKKASAIADLQAAGWSLDDIASCLGCKPNTLKGYLPYTERGPRADWVVKDKAYYLRAWRKKHKPGGSE